DQKHKNANANSAQTHHQNNNNNNNNNNNSNSTKNNNAKNTQQANAAQTSNKPEFNFCAVIPTQKPVLNFILPSNKFVLTPTRSIKIHNEFLFVANAQYSTIFDRKDIWIFDSGASRHMTSQKILFSDYHEILPVEIILGDNHTLQAIGEGTYYTTVKSPHGDYSGKLIDVLYVPNITKNLLSVGNITNNNANAIFRQFDCLITCATDNTILAYGGKEQNTYYLNCVPNQINMVNTAIDTNILLWHYRLGHASIPKIQQLSQGMAVGISIPKNISENFLSCKTCIKGKMHKTAISKIPAQCAQELFFLIHNDLCGLMNTPSKSGYLYTVSFIDDKSCYCWIFFLHHKNEAMEKYKILIVYIRTHFKVSIKFFQSDNGGEYINLDFQNLLASED